MDLFTYPVVGVDLSQVDGAGHSRCLVYVAGVRPKVGELFQGVAVTLQNEWYTVNKAGINTHRGGVRGMVTA